MRRLLFARLVKRIGDAPYNIKPECLVLIPALVAVIQDVIHLKPEIKAPGNAEFSPCIKVKGTVSFESISGLGQELWPRPGP